MFDCAGNPLATSLAKEFPILLFGICKNRNYGLKGLYPHYKDKK